MKKSSRSGSLHRRGKRSPAWLALILGASLAAHTVLSAVFNDEVSVEVVVSAGESSISISATNLAWTSYVVPNVIDRVNSEKMTCQFFPGAGPWQINVFHTNSAGQALKRIDGSESLLTRVWQPNFGPTNFYALGYMPNPMDTNVWSKSPAVGYQSGPGIFARQEKSDRPPIDFHFMIDARNAPTSTFEGTIFFELQVP